MLSTGFFGPSLPDSRMKKQRQVGQRESESPCSLIGNEIQLRHDVSQHWASKVISPEESAWLVDGDQLRVG